MIAAAKPIQRCATKRSAALALLPSLFLALSACESVDLGRGPAASPSMGMIIAKDHCEGCHQTGGSGTSPNPRAPTFGQIASRPGMTKETLAAWLRDAHNYPVEMGFSLDPQQADSLSEYMIRWRSE